MWPRDAYVGQHVVALQTVHWRDSVAFGLEKGKVYTIRAVHLVEMFNNAVYLSLHDDTTIITRADLVRPVDESRLDVFRAALKRKGVWKHADA